jgi:hypothetical protein
MPSENQRPLYLKTTQSPPSCLPLAATAVIAASIIAPPVTVVAVATLVVPLIPPGDLVAVISPVPIVPRAPETLATLRAPAPLTSTVVAPHVRWQGTTFAVLEDALTQVGLPVEGVERRLVRAGGGGARGNVGKARWMNGRHRGVERVGRGWERERVLALSRFLHPSRPLDDQVLSTSGIYSHQSSVINTKEYSSMYKNDGIQKINWRWLRS